MVFLSQVMTAEQPSSWVKDSLLVGMASVLIALCAGVSIPLPFTPVPLVLASHVCLALAVTMGSRRAALAVCLYLLQGVMGLPVFALGKSGIMTLLGPTGGYLWGYVAATYVTGFLLESWGQRTGLRIFSALAIGNAIIYLCGVAQLTLILGLQSAVFAGVLPFLAGDAIKLWAVYRGMRFFQ